MPGSDVAFFFLRQRFRSHISDVLKVTNEENKWTAISHADIVDYIRRSGDS